MIATAALGAQYIEDGHRETSGGEVEVNVCGAGLVDNVLGVMVLSAVPKDIVRSVAPNNNTLGGAATDNSVQGVGEDELLLGGSDVEEEEEEIDLLGVLLLKMGRTVAQEGGAWW